MKRSKPFIKALSLFANVGIAEAYLEEIGIELSVRAENLPFDTIRLLYEKLNK